MVLEQLTTQVERDVLAVDNTADESEPPGEKAVSSAHYENLKSIDQKLSVEGSLGNGNISNRGLYAQFLCARYIAG